MNEMASYVSEAVIKNEMEPCKILTQSWSSNTNGDMGIILTPKARAILSAEQQDINIIYMVHRPAGMV